MHIYRNILYFHSVQKESLQELTIFRTLTPYTKLPLTFSLY